MTRLHSAHQPTDHDLMIVQPNDHHPPVEILRVQVSGISIPPGDYDYEVALTYSDHRVVEVMIAGPTTLSTGGRLGAWAAGTQTQGQASSRFIAGSGVYTYIASFSRLHGDTLLSGPQFGTGISWKDLWISGSSAWLKFNNSQGSSQTLRFWGTVMVK